MASEEGKVKIDKFNGKDFGFWKMQIEDYLYQKKMHLPLSGEKPEKMTKEEWDLLDRQALGVIRLSLTRNVAFNIIDEKTTSGLMSALSNMYEKPSASNKVHLMRRLFNLKMTEGGSVTEHINEFNVILTQLSSVSITFDDEVKALILLSSLPESWSATVTAVSSSSRDSKLKLDDIRDLILSEDIRRRESSESSGSALNTESRGRTSQRGQSYGRGRSKPRRRSQSKNRKEIICWNCDKKGHFSSQCREPKKKREQQKEDNSANITAEQGGDALICSVDSPVESWILDSGASFHSTPSKELLHNYVAGNFGKVYLADDEPLDIMGKGEVHIKTAQGMLWKLQNVRHVPGLKKNLISMGQIDGEGYTTVFGDGSWKITKGNLVVARGSKNGTLYATSIQKDIVAAVDSDRDSILWHRRLGHMSEKGMKLLASNEKLPNLKHVQIGLCEDCVYGKQKRVSFSKAGRTPKKEKLELVHTDVWGPAPVNSLGGSRYYVTFIDDSTRKVWVYFLKNKSDVFATFKRWKAEVENQTGLKIKCLKSDNGGEYDRQEFKAFCSQNGIRMIKTVPGTPEQNGVAARMKRTLNERARSMRIHSSLPKHFWAEAVNTAAYLINRSPSVPLDFKLPEEVWTGKEVKLSHLKIFGCVAYVHVNSNDRDKLDPKAKKCFFIGYGNDNLGYRFWDDENRKIIRHRDVTFNESVMYKDRLGVESNSNKQTTETVELEEISEDDVARGGRIDSEIGEPELQARSESESEMEPELETSSEAVTPESSLRRSQRVIRPPNRYSPSLHYLLLTDAGEPEHFGEAMQIENSDKWKMAMKDEMNSLHKNNTWMLTELPDGKKALQNKWVYRVKEEHDGKKRYKARLVVKGFQQKQGIDYTEIFSPVVKLTTIRLVLSIVAAENLHLEQLDVKTAFLHGDLEEDIYMKQPEGFQVPGKENLVCRLKKSLYGLKQAPRQWYKKFDGFMHNNDFRRCEMDHCCYIKNVGGSYIILLLYVDDMLIAGSSIDEINRVKQQLAEEFEMKDLGPAKQMLGMRISRDRSEGTLNLSQEKYIEKVLNRFSLQDAKTRNTPLGSHLNLSKKQCPKTDEERRYMSKVPYASAVGSLMYAMVCTRPDIAHAVGVVSRYMSKPGKEHWEGVKWILRYLKGTSGMSLCFRKSNIILQGYSDADLGGDLDSRKSTTGYVFTLGGTAISWMSRLQKSVALSTTEAEYMANSEAAKEMIWLKRFLEELGKKQGDCELFSDSQSAIYLAKNPVFHARSKHIQLRYHFIRKLIEDETLSLKKIRGSKNPADMLTKAVGVDKLRLCIASVGLQD